MDSACSAGQERHWGCLEFLGGSSRMFVLGGTGQSCRNQALHHRAKQPYRAQVSEKLKETPWDVGSTAGPAAASHHWGESADQQQCVCCRMAAGPLPSPKSPKNLPVAHPKRMWSQPGQDALWSHLRCLSLVLVTWSQWKMWGRFQQNGSGWSSWSVEILVPPLTSWSYSRDSISPLGSSL